MTLIEAALGVALLGGLLVGILGAHRRLREQSARLERRREACRIADELLERWWSKGKAVPVDRSGAVPERKGWRYRTSLKPDSGIEAISAEVVVLEILHDSAPEQALIRLELLSHESTPR